jgi:anti-sigma factor RsiW
MNAGFDLHCSEDQLERYALGMLSDEDGQTLEEHLLICFTCQHLLARLDDFIRIAKAALDSEGGHGARRRWSKPVAAAVTLA